MRGGEEGRGDGDADAQGGGGDARGGDAADAVPYGFGGGGGGGGRATRWSRFGCFLPCRALFFFFVMVSVVFLWCRAALDLGVETRGLIPILVVFGFRVAELFP